MMSQRIAVIGGVAAGPAAAASARRTDPEAEIVLFEAGSDISYSACEMPYYLSGLVDTVDDLVRYTPDRFRRERLVDVRVLSAVSSIDPRKGIIEYEDSVSGHLQSEPFDKFILATGARAAMPVEPSVGCDNVFALRTLDDGKAMHEFLESTTVHHAVVVGAGFVGLEVAEALNIRGIRVTLLEPGTGPLHTSLDEKYSAMVAQILADRGISVRREGLTSFVKGTGGNVSAVVTTAGEHVGCQMVAMCTGTIPVTALATACGVKLGRTGGIRTDARMRTNLPNVWACGDCTEILSKSDGRPVLSKLSLTAFRTGRVAGINAARRGSASPARFEGVIEAQALRLFDFEIACAGLSLLQAKTAGYNATSISVRHVTGSRHLLPENDISVRLVFDVSTGRLYGGQLIGRTGTAQRANVLVALLREKQDVAALYDLDMIYAPPFSPRLDPLLVAARKAIHVVKQSRDHV